MVVGALPPSLAPLLSGSYRNVKPIRHMSSPSPTSRAALACAALLCLASTSHAELYLPPANSFVTTPSGSETIVQLQDTSGSIATAQTTLNNARTAHPSAILVLNLDATTYSVDTTGLVLGSNECLVLSPTTTIQAASSTSTAGYLVQVATGSTNVSISGGTFNGTGANLNCIQVAASTRVNISNLTASNCASNVIQVYGPGQTTFDSELTIANCTISQGTSTYSGISLHNATQAAILDNTISGFTSGSAIYAKNCAYCTIAENTCSSSTNGIYVLGNNNSITDNTCSADGTGIVLAGNAGATSANLCTSNTLNNNTTVAISASGIGDTIFDNVLSGNTATLTLAGSGNNVIARKAALTTGQNYFYPPLVDDQHSTTIVAGKNRTDVTITSNGSTTLSSVQSQYNTARSNNPNNVIVLHLGGTGFVGDSTLTLSSYTCVILTTTIHVNSGVNAISASGASYVSISGGTIDGGNAAKTAITFSSGCFMVQVDGMTIQNFGPITPRGSGTDAVHTSGSGTPFLMTRCTVNQGSNRGLWLESAGYQAVVSRNTFSNFNEDGIDCDAHTATSLIKYNTCSGNYRAGIFVEQGDAYDVLLGNTCTTNHRSGISVWNNGVNSNISPTEYNSVICNICDSSVVGTPSSGSGNSTGYGLETGSQAGSAYQEYVTHNFCFNNEVESNQGTGQQDVDIGQGSGGSTGSVQNYFSDNIVVNNASVNGSNIATSSNGGDVFFNSVVPYEFDPVTMSPVGSGAPIGSTADANTPFGELEFLNATGTGQTLTLTTLPMVAGSYSVQFGYKAYTARGQCTVKIDGTQVGGTIDQYSATTQYPLVTLGTISLSAGAHTIVLTVTGKNASSTAYTITADDFTFVGQ